MLLSCIAVHGASLQVNTNTESKNQSDYNKKLVVMRPYMEHLEKKIKNNWHPPKDDKTKRVTVMFKIARDGRLLEHKITKSSNSPLADKAAMQAIEMSCPFAPLPEEFKGGIAPIEFTFDYKVKYNDIMNNYSNSEELDIFNTNQCKTKFCKFMQKY